MQVAAHGRYLNARRRPRYGPPLKPGLITSNYRATPEAVGDLGHKRSDPPSRTISLPQR